ncbi:MAG: hypothetical protein EXR98_03395 [Gemmataceae bacterium]|nr:hypothetical protein [Gemmataceae bacterium]
MLSDQVLQLLTAFVDGELEHRQREAVVRLLKESSEARDVLRQLQENTHKIKQLPQHKVEPSLVDAVLQAITEQQVQPKQPAPAREARRRWLPYVTASLAASLLIGVIGFLSWKALTEPTKDDIIVKNTQPEIKPEPKPDPTPSPTPKKTNPLLSDMIAETFRGFGAPVPVEKPFAVAFHDIQNGGAQELNRELNRDKAVQFDITVKSNSDAMKRLKDVLKYREISLVTDPAAEKKLQDKNQAKVEYLVFAENLTPDEMTRLMSELGESFVVGLNKTQRLVESPYKNLAVKPVAKDDRQKVAKLLGVEPSAIEPKDSKDVQPQPKNTRQVVLLPMNANGAASKEVQQFVNQRRATQPGTIQVFIKIRQE